MAKKIMILGTSVLWLSACLSLATGEVPQDEVKPTLAALLNKSRADLDALSQKKEFAALAGREAEWASKIETFLKDNPDSPNPEQAYLYLVTLHGSAADGGKKIQELYERVKGQGFSKPWFVDFLKRSFYLLRKKDRAALSHILTDAAANAALAEVKAASLFFHGQALMDGNDNDGAKKLFDRVIKEFPTSPFNKSAQGYLHEITALQPGLAAPECKIAGLDGGEIDVAAFKGKVVLLVFWTHWAPLLPARIPILNTLQNKHRADPFALVGILLDEPSDVEAARKAMADYKITWPQGYDPLGWNSPVAGRYNIQSTPRAFLIDPNGKLLAKDILYTSNLEVRVKNEIEKRKAEIQKAKAAADAAKKKAADEAAKKKAAADAAKKAAAQPKPAKK